MASLLPIPLKLPASFHLPASLHLPAAVAPHSALLAIPSLAVFLLVIRKPLEPLIRFAWSCFLQPIGKTNSQAERLDRFYKNQADVYDTTRNRLLRGRRTMLKMCAAHLMAQQPNWKEGGLIWVDIGGGTGWNIEEMASIMPLSAFSHIYLIDLCEPLLEVARKRFEAKGWKNVHVLCQDATMFDLVGLEKGGKGTVDLVTMSYSLSMIPNFYQVVDRVYEHLAPQTGFCGVCDFYVSSKDPSPFEQVVGGSSSRRCHWFSGWFWQTWFSFDHVNLHPNRRDYLEYKFGTVKCFNGRNHFLLPFIQIPYYIWLGVSRERDTSEAVKRFEIEAGNTVACPPSFPELSYSHLIESSRNKSQDPGAGIKETHLGQAGVAKNRKELAEMSLALSPTTFPNSSFHYQHKHWRLPYVDKDFDKEFRTWIYSFTWEDPEEDMRHLNLSEDDSMLVITSAGDNALHYAIEGKPKRIHAVDMNACQGSLLELKMAAIASLPYDRFWHLFGKGKAINFRDDLDSKISPFLSSHAYQFWRQNEHSFDSAFYLRGYSGHALRLAKFLFWLAGASKHVDEFCSAPTLAEQKRIWETKLRRVLLGRQLVRAVISSPIFTWNALGVPCNQLDCFRKEGVTALQFLEDTIDPIIGRALLKNENYHYYLCLKQQYSKECCPRYLQSDGFAALKADNAALLDRIMIHTASIVQVCRGLESESLTRAILMDHLDWADPFDSDATPAPTSSTAPGISWVDSEIFELRRVVKKGGIVFWRSAAKHPWYNARFAKMGFKVEAISIRESGTSIDNVNMYASFYKATKLDA